MSIDDSLGQVTSPPTSNDPGDSGHGVLPSIPEDEMRRARIAGGMGTMLENIDMVLYSTATAVVFNQLFFPNVSPAIGYIASFGAYAVGFGARPLGGFVFGHFGERLGRKFVMVATLFLMGTATFSMGLLPTYEQVGILAPILLIVLRFIQGFGAGAEMASAVVLLTEFAQKGRRGRTASWVWIGASIGFVIASLLWIGAQRLLSDDALLSWGWRVIFMSSILVTVAAWIIRRTLKESPVFDAVKARRSKEAKAPIADVLAHGRRPLFRVFLMSYGVQTHSYIYNAFVGAYLIGTVGVNKSLIPNMLLLGGLVAAPGCYLVARASDRFGRRSVNIAVMSLLLVFSAPAFLMLRTGVTWLIAIVYIIGFIFAVEGAVAAQAPTYAELFGSRYRFAGVALGRELAAALGGGLAPFICAALLSAFSKSIWPIAIFMMVAAGISLIQLVMLPETVDRDLLTEADA
ncbi:MAG: hypothetical protein QG671_3055 [Actinomycetota bacterium]|nr:hypothetical protein [Actinomycetota bacterium]